MGIFCCFPDPVDFDAEVNLFHFDLHRAVGKGAFGKVSCDADASTALPLTCIASGSSRRAQAYQEAIRSEVYREGQVHQTARRC